MSEDYSSLTTQLSSLPLRSTLIAFYRCVTQYKNKKNMSQINSFRDLIVYQKAYKLAMEIFEITQSFPKEEKYSLTDQIRRSSRSITSNIAEAWSKRIYPKSFVSKLSDSLGEEYETEGWLDYSLDCKYIDKDQHTKLLIGYDEVRKMLISMMNNPEKFCK
jgi:four helix bundle protein